MESIPEEKGTRGVSGIREEIRGLRKEISLAEARRINEKEKKPFKFPLISRVIMWYSKKSAARKKILAFGITRKNELTLPMLLPIFSNDMVIWGESPYKLDPRAILRFGGCNAYILREIDRQPVSNIDYGDIKDTERSTDADNLLFKALSRAIYQQDKKKMNIFGIILIGVVSLVVFFLLKSAGIVKF